MIFGPIICVRIRSPRLFRLRQPCPQPHAARFGHCHLDLSVRPGQLDADDRACAWPLAGGGNNTMSQPASSAHTGGVNVLLCDDSVRFVAQTVNLAVWRGVGSRLGAEIIPGEY